MKHFTTKTFLLLLFLIFNVSSLLAATFTSVQNGNWEDPNTWGKITTTPGIGDIVTISGHEVTLNSNRSISQLNMASDLLTNHSKLIINNSELIISSTSSDALKMTSLSVLKNVQIVTNGTNGILDIAGGIEMSALAPSNVLINTKDHSVIKIAGNINRLLEFGKILMEDNSSIIFNGSNTQILPSNILPAALSDSLVLKNITLQNTSSQPVTLEGRLTITDSLTLTNGNIITTTASPLVIADNAKIKGGSENAYVQGPIIKKGRTNGRPFIFPIGSATKYAPLVMEFVSSVSSVYTAQYYSDPPPFGNMPESAINPTSNPEYWKFDPATGSDLVEITLPYDDVTGASLTDTNDLVVAGSSNFNDWISYGKSKVNEELDGSGSVASNYTSDPPPFGVIWYTIMTESAAKALPVELSMFRAVQNNKTVDLFWRTMSEQETSHFEIYRSEDGVKYERIGVFMSGGNSNEIKDYHYNDKEPNQGYNYYRLKIIDLDGSFEYSPIEFVRFIDPSTIRISPNPVEESINIHIDDADVKSGKVEIFDRSGKLLYLDEVAFEFGRATIEAEVVNINQSDIYFVRVTTIGNSYVLKFLKAE